VAPADDETVLRWSGGELRSLGAERSLALLAADSWLVEDGAVRGYDAHWERFAGWTGELGLAAEELGGFRAAVTAQLPRAGRWFPRVEVVADDEHGGLQLRLRLRPARPAASEARVLVAPPGDPRLRPTWKGPDVELLHELRAQATAAGADELMLCDADGLLVESVFDSLLWWEDEALCTTPFEGTLAGVTRRLLLEIARRRGVELRLRSPLPGELTTCETWLTNALHGIRVVTAWGGEIAAPAPRAAQWRTALARTARPIA
jgi:branched-subunit amino acid aminotransferase/4-amino-4-deoxychorismate lyase